MAFDKACEGVQNGDLPIDEISRSLAIEKGEDDVTLLHWAAYNNRCRIVRRLIECGADVNVSGANQISEHAEGEAVEKNIVDEDAIKDMEDQIKAEKESGATDSDDDLDF